MIKRGKITFECTAMRRKISQGHCSWNLAGMKCPLWLSYEGGEMQTYFLQPVEATDDAFWDQFWADTATTVQDVFALVPAAEIRAVREESPSNLATLCYKAVEKLVQGAESGCPTEREKQVILNCTRILTRILPYIFEDQDWRGFFWSTVPGAGRAGTDELDDDDGARPLAELLLLAIADLLFCPDFTVHSHKRGPDSVENMQSIDSCEYIWEAGVGFAQSPPLNYIHDLNRTELLRLLLTCFSEAMYLPPSSDNNVLNPWVTFFCSAENRHALPLFTSLLNVVCAYDPVGYGIPYNHLLFSDYREQLVEQAVQILIVTLEHDGGVPHRPASPSSMEEQESTGPENLFVNYLSRIHREEDFDFVLKGLARLLTNPLTQTYLPNSTKKIQFHQELLVLFWKLCDFNKKFLFFVLKSSDVLDVLVPILYYLNDARADQLSPYLKSLSMVAANKLLHLLEAFSTSWFLFSAAQNHHLVFFLLEAFNNIIQYQFDGNCNLVYAIIRKRNVFHQLANLPSDPASIQKALQRKRKSPDVISRTSSQETVSMEGSHPAVPAEPGTLKASLVAMPGIDKLTEKSQVSEDGTMVSVPKMDSPHTVHPDQSAVAGTSDTESNSGRDNEDVFYTEAEMERRRLSSASSTSFWAPTQEWVLSWKSKLPLQTIMRLLQVLVPQVEKICIDKGLTDESEILKFLQHGTLVGLLPVPHPILIRKYQANAGTAMWFRTYMWGVVYLRNVDPPIWYDTDVRLFEIQRM
ncbi:protein HID1 isoform X6 [Xiphias gladius]|uniref:protein HID1 isoform X6 n=1 Tax=Xiphias gladius TaxID=8245 RepID=UPI001A9988AF|nr:protein HID1 isoform X6 [Xiphias gladius]